MSREMKDSGIEWIGAIPNKWTLSKLKFISNFIQEKAHLAEELDYIGLENIVPWSGKIIITDSKYDSEQALLCYEKDILFGKLRPYLAKVHISEKKQCCSSEFAVIRIKNYNTVFYWFYLISEGFISTVNKSTYGTKMPRANPDLIKNMVVLIPPIEEQSAISSFLTERIQHIDDLISLTTCTIEEYKKLKQSIITETILNGLKTNTSKKNEDNDYYHSIPSHWKLTSLKRMCNKITDGSHYSPEITEIGKPYITASDILGIGIDYNKCKKISIKDYEDLEKNGCRPHAGDILLVKDGATTGRTGMMIDNEECVLLSSVAMISPKQYLDSKYLMYLFQSEPIQQQIKHSMAGSAMPRITLSKLIDYTIIDCPIDEQKEIVDYLTIKTKAIDDLIRLKEKSLNELQNYKKAIIFEYATGKKEVSAPSLTIEE